MPGTNNTVNDSVWNGSDEPNIHIDRTQQSGVDFEDRYRHLDTSTETQTPNPNNFMTAAEYERAMRRFISENGPVIKQSKNKDNKVNSTKELLSFIRFVKDQLKDNIDKSTPEGLNLIEDLLSEEKMMEIVDNYCC